MRLLEDESETYIIESLPISSRIAAVLCSTFRYSMCSLCRKGTEQTMAAESFRIKKRNVLQLSGGTMQDRRRSVSDMRT